MFWVRTEPQWRFDAVPPYGPVPGLFLGSLQYFGSWVHSTSHITAGFHHIGSCPMLPPSPAGLRGPIQEDTAEPQSQGELWRSAPLGSVRRDRCLTVCGSTSCLLIWGPLFIFCNATCFLCPAHSSTYLCIFSNQFYVLVFLLTGKNYLNWNFHSLHL